MVWIGFPWLLANLTGNSSMEPWKSHLSTRLPRLSLNHPQPVTLHRTIQNPVFGRCFWGSRQSAFEYFSSSSADVFYFRKVVIFFDAICLTVELLLLSLLNHPCTLGCIFTSLVGCPYQPSFDTITAGRGTTQYILFSLIFLVVLHFKLFYSRYLEITSSKHTSLSHAIAIFTTESTWNYLTESERWLAVYPTSWQHHLHTSGPIRNTSYTWRIIPVTKWLVTPVYNPFRSFGRGTTLLMGLTNRGY